MTPKERGFNVPKTLRDSIKDALTTDREHLLPHELSIAEEIASGKVVYKEHIEWLQEFFSSIDVQYLLHGGDDARQWLDKVDSPSSVVASGFSGRDEWVFFVTGPDEKATLAEAVYSIDPKTEHLFSWNGEWTDLGSVFDSNVESPFIMEVDFTTAKGVAEWSMGKHKSEKSIDIRLLDPVEYNIYRKAQFALDYKMLDRVTDFITVDTGEDPELLRERSKNAQKQARDGSGRFGPTSGPSNAKPAGEADPGAAARAVDADGKKPETKQSKQARLSAKYEDSLKQLDTAKTDDEAVQERIDSTKVRATLEEGTANSPQPSDEFLEEFRRGEAEEVDNRDEKNRPKTTFADEASYEPDPDAIQPTDISGLPESSRAFVAIVDKDDHNAVLNLAVLAKVEAKVYAFVRMNSAWYSAPELLTKFESTDPPFLVKLEDEAQIGSVIEQIDSGDLGAEDREEATSNEEEEAIAAAMKSYEISGDGSDARDAVILASLTGNHRLLTREVIIASGLGLLDSRSVDDYGTILASAGDLEGADVFESDYAAARRLKRYWLHGPGAAKIRWGSPGDWTRCVRHLSKYMGPRAKGYCQLRHKDATGMYTGDKAHK